MYVKNSIELLQRTWTCWIIYLLNGHHCTDCHRHTINSVATESFKVLKPSSSFLVTLYISTCKYSFLVYIIILGFQVMQKLYIHLTWNIASNLHSWLIWITDWTIEKGSRINSSNSKNTNSFCKICRIWSLQQAAALQWSHALTVLLKWWNNRVCTVVNNEK